MQAPAEIQSVLERVPDEYLMREMQHPSGNVPQYLVMAELQRRKKLREVGQAQQADGQPTTVAADTMQGVASLPAENMTNLKHGGVVGFQYGGEIAKEKEKSFSERLKEKLRFGPEGTFLTPERVEEARKAMIEGDRGGFLHPSYVERYYDREDGEGGLVGMARDANSAINKFLPGSFAAPSIYDALASGFGNSDFYTAQFDPDYYTKQSDNYNARDALLARGVVPGSTDAATPAPSTPAPGSKEKTRVSVSGRGSGVDGFKPPVFNVTGLNLGDFVPPDINAMDVMNRERELRKAAGVEGQAGQGVMDYLDKMTAKAEGMEKSRMGNSLMEAGLAMMAGESPHFFTNVGKGLQQGVSRYRDIGKELSADELERMKLGAGVEQARRAEGVSTADAAHKAEIARRAEQVTGKREMAKTGYEGQLKQAQFANDLARTDLSGRYHLAATREAAQARAAGIKDNSYRLVIELQDQYGRDMAKLVEDPRYFNNPVGLQAARQELTDRFNATLGRLKAEALSSFYPEDVVADLRARAGSVPPKMPPASR